MTGAKLQPTTKFIRRPPSRWRLVGALLIILLGFGAGVLYGRASAPVPGTGRLANGNATSTTASTLIAEGAPPNLSKEVDFPLFWDIWKRIKERYVRQPVTDADLFHGALEGMVASLDDPYSVYFSPKLADEFNKELEGTFEGIGAEIGIKNNRLVIVAPLPDTPASRAGLRAGDAIISIDEVSSAGMSVEQAVSKIRGKAGTKVSLNIIRNGKKDPFKVEVTREKIVVKSVRFETRTTKGGSKIGWIQLRQFNDDTIPLLDQAARELLRDNPKGIVIDLRNNPGGYLESALNAVGFWRQGTAVIEKKYNGEEESKDASGKTQFKDLPTVVLVNQGSASGAEILAGALQDYGLAKIVGKKTFGKGSVQDYQELKDGGALKLTVAEWLTPKKRSINKEGIAPDIELDLTDEDANADRDPQLDKAYELIDSWPAAESKN
ncbi:S41 family peptidase [Patescibacteria group bacterium]|nr:MAG: S41 family peptidase [Patescibacteria group bacterium]